MTGWDEFAAGLAEELAALPEGAIVKVIQSSSTSEVGPYAQFLQTADRVWAELVSDKWLNSAAQAGAAGNDLIAGAGWQLPDFQHGDNWWIELPWPIRTADYARLATMVVVGLRDALHVPAPTDLVYRAWNENTGNTPLELPALGLSRAG
ncbi:TY-Chap domain-containing protein [Nocardia brasiliensis]|uniref:TY-Chap N-terminal domain-containing protein n=1 Tax=Nocardia brasiliensis (strain ATCC 700358 / HUJEG-1) TaxID=1133849 RepID=K0EPX3_NOCB7|nr:hypothetical protein [Nocardia brasiliensis]AFT98879.1 hypothetical protein O3I_004585 [Nocardia brasiliensis ATCC 700358]OCF87065.1 hypothetical protein AW168_26780 [Nocardia brasiliensis]